MSMAWRLLMLVAAAVVIGIAHPVAAQDYTVDSAASAELTSYLRHHRLPLVSGQVLTGASGKRLILSGYVASDFGRTDAARKARTHFGESGIPIDNRIVVRPEIREMGANAAPPVADASAAESGAADTGAADAPTQHKTFDEIMNEIQRYGVHSPPDEQGLPQP